MNNTRLSFALDTGGNPVSASPYVQTGANFLVEEYMLLANMRVAALIARAFPKHALLRCGAGRGRDCFHLVELAATKRHIPS
jgi:exoribonuclease R